MLLHTVETLTCSDSANSARTRGKAIRHCAVLADKHDEAAPGLGPAFEYLWPPRLELGCITCPSLVHRLNEAVL